MIRKIWIRWKVNKLKKSIDNFVFFYENLAQFRIYIEEKLIRSKKKKYAKLNRYLSKVNLDIYNKFLNTEEIRDKVNIFIQYYLSVDEYYKKINDEIKLNENKVSEFLHWINSFKVDPENYNNIGDIKSQYFLVNEFIRNGLNKRLQSFIDFSKYYCALETYTVLWKNIKDVFQKANEFNNLITPNRYLNSDKKNRIINHYAEDYRYIKCVEKNEILSDYSISINNFLKTYHNLESIIIKNNSLFLDTNLKQAFLNAFNKNTDILKKKDHLYVTALINQITDKYKIPDIDIEAYLNSLVSKIDNSFEGYIHQTIENKTNYKILSNIYLRTNSNALPYTQIDHIIFAKDKIFVIEAKDYLGKIYGSYQKDYWKQCIVNRYSYKNSFKTYTSVNQEEFRSPIKQNNWHINCLKGIYDFTYTNLVVFSDSAELYVPVKSVINYKQLLHYLNEQTSDEGENSVFLKELYYRLCLLNEGNNNKVKREHVAAIQHLYN